MRRSQDPRAYFVFQLSSSLLARFELTLQAVYSDKGLSQLSLYPKKFLTPLSHGLQDCRRPARIIDQFEALKAKLLARLNGEPANMAWREFDLRGYPPFHLRVWKALHAVPFGATVTYGELAKAAGSPRASRACGQACGANPIVLFIPCHRVVGGSSLGGFGCGIEWKKRFLALEGVDWRQLSPAASPRGT